MAQPKSSKQKRAAQNKATRQALAARSSNARIEPGTTASSGTAPRKRGGLRGLLNPTPPVKRTAGSPTSARGAAAARASEQPPGQRAATIALMAALVGLVMFFILPVDVTADGDLYTKDARIVTWANTAAVASADAPDASPAELVKAIGDDWMPGAASEPAFIAVFPLSLGALLPAIGALLAFRAVKQRKPSKTISRLMFLTLLGTLVSQQPILFLPVVIALGFAMYQVRKTEVAAASVAVGDPSTGEVVEAEVVDVVDGDDVGDEVSDVDVEALDDDAADDVAPDSDAR